MKAVFLTLALSALCTGIEFNENHITLKKQTATPQEPFVDVNVFDFSLDNNGQKASHVLTIQPNLVEGESVIAFNIHHTKTGSTDKDLVISWTDAPTTVAKFPFDGVRIQHIDAVGQNPERFEVTMDDPDHLYGGEFEVRLIMGSNPISGALGTTPVTKTFEAVSKCTGPSVAAVSRKVDDDCTLVADLYCAGHVFPEPTNAKAGIRMSNDQQLTEMTPVIAEAGDTGLYDISIKIEKKVTELPEHASFQLNYELAGLTGTQGATAEGGDLLAIDGCVDWSKVCNGKSKITAPASESGILAGKTFHEDLRCNILNGKPEPSNNRCRGDVIKPEVATNPAQIEFFCEKTSCTYKYDAAVKDPPQKKRQFNCNDQHVWVDSLDQDDAVHNQVPTCDCPNSAAKISGFGILVITLLATLRNSLL